MNTTPTTRYRRIVIKLGTSTLTNGTPNLDRAQMVELARQCVALRAKRQAIIICSSAAIAVGRAQLDFPNLPATIVSKQLLAAVGQPRLMQVWESLFDIYQVQVGQILLTRADVEDRRRYLNARNALDALLEHGIIPIINENDAVATEEIRVGDNDNLSALVATLVSADLLLILTDQPGLFTDDPRTNPDAKLIPEVHKIDEHLRAIAGGSKSGLGIGGMATKLQAADIARRAGADVVIAPGHARDVILRAVAGESVGTRFPALSSRIENRKRWILAGPQPAGALVVDDGAVHAICHQGRSLLPAGIRAIKGDFHRGDTVAVTDLAGHEVARGLVAYNSADLGQIQGCHSDEIATRLDNVYGATAIHRNDMVILTD